MVVSAVTLVEKSVTNPDPNESLSSQSSDGNDSVNVPEVTAAPTGDNEGNNPEGSAQSSAEKKTFPGIVFWIACRGFDFQLQEITERYQQLITMTGIQLLECQVSNLFFLIHIHFRYIDIHTFLSYQSMF